MKHTFTAIVLTSALALASPMVFAKGGHHGGDQRWEKLDTNGDGEISSDEFASQGRELIENADTDGNGAISREEMKAYRKAKREERRAQNNPDTNADGVIDRGEYLIAAEARFDKADKNGDGVLSEEERPRRQGRKGGRHGNK